MCGPYLSNSPAVGGTLFLVIRTLFGSLFVGFSARADVILVPGDHETIQQAIQVAADGDEIVVSQGVYAESLHFLGKAIVVRSADPADAAVVAGTVLDGTSVSVNHMVQFVSGEGPESLLAGFTVANHSTFHAGAGIRVDNASMPTIEHCVFDNLHADAGGGGIFVNGLSAAVVRGCTFRNIGGGSVSTGRGAGAFIDTGSSARFIDCLFENNLSSGAPGGAIHSLGDSLEATRCTFRRNRGSTGNAVYLQDAVAANFDECVFDTNFGGTNGGAVHVRSSQAAFTECLFRENSMLPSGIGIQGGGALYINGSSPSIVRCRFLANKANNGVGGAIYAFGTAAFPTVSVSEFTGNEATSSGGAINTNGEARVGVIDSSFTNNTAVSRGGAIDLNGVSGSYFRDCQFTGNTVTSTGGNGFGGAVSSGSGANFVLDSYTGCTFLENEAASYGGALSGRAFHLRECRFERNRAISGGGAVEAAESHSQIFNCAFLANSTENHRGGAAWLGGGDVVNSIFIGNFTGGEGGGIYGNAGSLRVTNSTFYGNSAVNGSGLLIGWCCGNTSRVANSIIRGNTGGAQFVGLSSANVTIDQSNVEGVVPGGSLINADPRFVRTPYEGDDGVWGTDDDDYGDLRLGRFSPSIDAGDADALPADLLDLDDDGDSAERTPWDLDGRTRLFDDSGVADTGAGNPGYSDHGAYERHRRSISDTLAWYTMDGGGFMHASTGNVEMSATIGQADAGMMTGGDVVLIGGFWFAAVPGDCLQNGRVDLFDFDILVECLTGPDGSVSGSACQCFDLDGNGMVDLLDASLFQTHYSGSGDQE